MRSIEKKQLQFPGQIVRVQGLESDCLLARANGKGEGCLAVSRHPSK